MIIIYLYSVIRKKTWQFIFDHNTEKLNQFFYNFCIAKI